MLEALYFILCVYIISQDNPSVLHTLSLILLIYIAYCTSINSVSFDV